jgi:cysteine desulfurase / selenocysteine lyase
MIYFDNAATSWPKPDAVGGALDAYFGEAGGNPGRSGHRMSVAAARVIEEGRESLAALFQVADPSRIVFTQNATHALNQAIFGLYSSGFLRPGDHVLTTSVEHNSVMRPLRHLESMGVALRVMDCAGDGSLQAEDAREAFRPNTKLVVSTHASNVTGTILPVAELTALAREHGAMSLIDASQTAGSIPIDIPALGADLLAFTGHKGLLGPTGTGGLYIREGVKLDPLLRGGTGSGSAFETQPEFLPDAYESGTPNVAGIAGLAAGARLLAEIGVESVARHERDLAARFVAGAEQIPGVVIYGCRDAARRCGIVSFNVAGATPSEVAWMLDDSFSILSRPGLHCAPAAHRTLGTFPGGTVRFSFGWFNTAAEIDESLRALGEIAEWAARAGSFPKEAHRT